MRNKFLLITITIVFITASFYYTQAQSTAKGVVYHDKNKNEIYDPGNDKPLKGIAVSNGRDVTVTNRNGEYELPLRNNSATFVIKPRNWVVSVDNDNVPRFYKMYSTTGISGTKFEGLSATANMPKSVDFPLYPRKESDNVKVLVFGDTQPRDNKEIYYMSKKILPELVGVNADFGVTLGDVVFNDLSIYDHLIGSLSKVGIPMWYVAGNHDLDYTGSNSTEARGTWMNTFGPSYYSFTYGPAHFIVLDNIRWIVDGDERYYRTGLGADQMEFLKNEMNRLDENQLVFILAHIPFEDSTPWYNEDEKKSFFKLLANHSNSVSLVAHTHRHYHQFIGEENGIAKEEPHHMISVGTVCGAWWTGAPDEYGVPHAMMSDGTPNGYAFLNIEGNKWKLKWKTAQVSGNIKMHIDAPDVISAENDAEFKVIANIYNALPDADVKMKIGDGKWIDMKRNPQLDPIRVAEKERENQLGEVPWRKMVENRESEHIWEAQANASLKTGVHTIQVKATDDWFEYEGKKLIYVK